MLNAETKTLKTESNKDFCPVCGKYGVKFKRYGVEACVACTAFFRRATQKGYHYTCSFTEQCKIDAERRSACRFCRYKKCLTMGMKKDGNVEVRRPKKFYFLALIDIPLPPSGARRKRILFLHLRMRIGSSTDPRLCKCRVRTRLSEDTHCFLGFLGASYLIGAFGVVIYVWRFTRLQQFYLYGKVNESRGKPWFLKDLFEVPKRWFWHFYLVASIWSTLVFCIISVVFIFRFRVPAFISLLEILGSASDNHKVSSTDVLLTVALFVAHALRRLTETLFVSVFSDTKINVLHYALGIMHYLLTPLCIISEAQLLLSNPGIYSIVSEITFCHIIGTLLFCWSSYEQHRIAFAFKNLRRQSSSSGAVDYSHSIPVSGWFNLVSCPHYFFEILIYVSLYLTLSLRHVAWLYVVTFVVVNQTIAALFTHRWYREKFKDAYPLERKALFPYLL